VRIARDAAAAAAAVVAPLAAAENPIIECTLYVPPTAPYASVALVSRVIVLIKTMGQMGSCDPSWKNG